VRRRAPLAALAIVACALAWLMAPAPASAVVVGIADNKPDMFADARLDLLGIRHARINVGWDVMTSDWQVAELDAWMNAAREKGVEPLISFGHSRTARRALPSPERFQALFRRLRARYPWARTFATWNEANHCGEPTCHRPRLVAAYHRKLRQACARCTILAAEVLDMPNMLAWVRAFRRASRVEPRWWGLHNYVEANRFRSTSLRRLLREVKGQVWLTEVGGIVRRRQKKRYTVKRIPESSAHARRVTQYLFDTVLPLSRRITRMYLYHWNPVSPKDTWDSALIGNDGRARPAFWVVHRELRDLRRRG
jgi:hypothetical protein